MPALTKVIGENLAASLPPGKVDEILRTIEARDRISLTSGLAYGAILVGAVGATIATPLMGWPVWVPGAVMAGASGALALANLLANRSIHGGLVREGHTCPRCRRAMFTNSWSMKEQQRQRQAIASGVCPRCAIPLVPEAPPA
jgi:hypothetical protein